MTHWLPGHARMLAGIPVLAIVSLLLLQAEVTSVDSDTINVTESKWLKNQ